MKKTVLILSLLLAPVAFAQDTTDTTTTETTTTTTETAPVETTETTTTETTDTTTETTDTAAETTDAAATNVENDAVTTTTEADGVAGNEHEPQNNGFPWGLLGLAGLAGLLGRSRPAPVVTHTATHTVPTQTAHRDTTVVSSDTTVRHDDRR